MTGLHFECSIQQRAYLFTVLRIHLNNKSCKAGKQHRAVGVNAKSSLELLPCLLKNPVVLQHMTVAGAGSEVIWGYPNHIAEKSEFVLPNPIVADAEKRCDYQNSGSEKVQHTLSWKRCPYNPRQ